MVVVTDEMIETYQRDGVVEGVLYRLQQDGRTVQVDELEIKYPLLVKELRLRVDQRGSGLGAGTPNLSFAMPGSRIVFLAQGQAPYQLAFDNEKARAANQKEAAKKQAEKAPASTETQASSGRTVKLQAGSFGSKEQAEAQRAKLALLGISAQVETAQVNGKSVHRVRTARLNENKAAQVRKQLSNNGIDSIAVGAN